MRLAQSRPRRWLAAYVLVVSMPIAGVCRADTPAKAVIVLLLAPGDSDLDVAELGAAVAKELDVDVVGADDPRADEARGTLTVGVDRGAHRLAVAYAARSRPLRREIDLPRDRDSATRAAVALAGNLARDEASDLAAELPSKRPASKAAAPARHAGDAVTFHDGEDAALVDANLGRTLDYYADRDRRSRLALTWAAFGTGAGFVGLGTYFAAQKNVSWMIGSYAVAGGLGLAGLVGLFATSRFEHLAAYHRAGANLAATEQAWVSAAADERRLRQVGGWFGVAGGGVVIATAVVFNFAFANASSPARASSEITSAVLLAAGTWDVLLGVFQLSTDGPVESALRAYERASGRTVSSPAAALAHLRFAAVPGGASAGFVTAF